MRLQYTLLAWVVAVAVPGLAIAQTGTTTGSNQTGTTTQTEPAGQPGTTTTTTTQTTTTRTERLGSDVSRWIASGYVGSNFGAASDGTAADFGGSVGYLWRGLFGGEFLTGFTPDFEPQNLALFAGEKPQVNSYMLNAITSVPLGADGQWQPFVSGGFGAVTLRSDALDPAVGQLFDADDTRPGGNIGVGVMGFAGPLGVRGDVRYFRAVGDDNADTSGSLVGSGFLPTLDFWRANIGLAVRW